MEINEILIKAAQFFLSLSLLIVLHELGHFIPAKIFKTRVEKFYLFFDPYFSLFKKKIGGTEYGIGWLPLGGYVKIAGMIDESMDKEQMSKPAEPWEFRSKPAWQRLIIMIGGVVVNLILAIVIYAGMAYAWGDQYVPTASVNKYGIAVDSVGEQLGLLSGDKILKIGGNEVEKFNQVPIEIILSDNIDVERNGQHKHIVIEASAKEIAIKSPGFISLRIPYLIGDFSADSEALKSGLKKGDKVVSLNGKEMLYFNEYIKSIPQHKGDSIKLGVLRGAENLEFDVFVPEAGKIGVALDADMEKYFDVKTMKYGLLESIPVGAIKAKDMLTSYIKQFKLILNPDTGAYKSVGGFLSIGKQFSPTWDWHRFWGFTAFLSIMLAFLNILPIPALDGGHVVFVLWEMISGRKPSEKVLEYAQIAGFVILMSLVVLANGNDILKLFLD
ncbi:MAG: RIP metalloprotease RseP [Ichthyobacteriaceae bacterium]|nr:RIP metalloprotease RseP [Ichthyobacteriaceae bacterium]